MIHMFRGSHVSSSGVPSEVRMFRVRDGLNSDGGWSEFGSLTSQTPEFEAIGMCSCRSCGTRGSTTGPCWRESKAPPMRKRDER
eukprot:7485479-Pyramimonas_sp.AAC.1